MNSDELKRRTKQFALRVTKNEITTIFTAAAKTTRVRNQESKR